MLNLKDLFLNVFKEELYIKSWLNVKLNSKTIGNRKFIYKSVKPFWNNVIHEVHKDGDVVFFKDISISEWFPKSAGMLWANYDFSKNTFEDDSLQEFYGKHRTGSVVNYYYDNKIDRVPKESGIIRLLPSENKDQYYTLSIISLDVGNLNLGVPLVVSRSVYSEYRKKIFKPGLVTADFIGVLRYRKNPMLNNYIEDLKKKNIDYNAFFVEQMFSSYGVNDLFIELLSPLNIQFTNGIVTGVPGSIGVFCKFNAADDRLVFSHQLKSCLSYDVESVRETVNIFSNMGLIKSDSEHDKKDPFREIKSYEILTEFDAQKSYFPKSVSVLKGDTEESIYKSVEKWIDLVQENNKLTQELIKNNKSMKIDNVNIHQSNVNFAERIENIEYANSFGVSKNDFDKLLSEIKTLDKSKHQELKAQINQISTIENGGEKESHLKKLKSFLLENGVSIAQSLAAATIFEVLKGI